MPPQTAAPLTRAAQFLAEGNLESAAQIAEAVLAERADADALHLMGVIRARQGRLEEAVTLFAHALVARPREPEVLLNFGKVLALMGQPDHAVAALSDAVRFRPDFTEAWHELANQQHRLGRLDAAEASYRRLLALDPGHGGAALGLGGVLVDGGRAAEAEAVLAPALAKAKDSGLAAGLAHNLGLAQHAQGKRKPALENFTIAQRHDPARTDLDRVRAHLLEETLEFDAALALYERIVARAPLDAAAHGDYNDLLYRLGREDELLKSYDRAPRTTPLQLAKAMFLLSARRAEDAHAVYADILAREPANQDAVSGAAAALSQMGRHGEAVAMMEEMAARHPDRPDLHIGLADASLKAGDAEKAAAMAEKGLALAPHDQLGLALLGTAWRVMGDERDESLNGYDTLIRVLDLDPPEGFSDMAAFNRELADALEAIHPPTREFIGQSARHGTQTRGHLFGAADDLVNRIEARIAEAIKRYIAELGADEAHPFLSRRRNGFAYAGSWSSRLVDCGFHVNHIHPAGWISSCYYVGVPEAVRDEQAKQGWIKFGEPSMKVDLAQPVRHAVQPVPGRLVLFPSYMWHGTVPFHSPETRLTIAFDAVAR